MIAKGKYWALFGDPRFYLVDEAVAELPRDNWTVKRSAVHTGDRVLIWRGSYRGHRGAVALGEVESEPAEMLPGPDSPRVPRREQLAPKASATGMGTLHPSAESPNLAR
jgi:hypothetical protein